MCADFASLPSPILTEICDYCEAQDIMALYGTCAGIRSLMDEMMLVVDGEFGWDDKTCRIPVFDTDHCRFVLLICKLRPEQYHCVHTILVESRPKHSNGRFTTVVWQKNVHSGWCLEMTFFIGFRNDPSQEYQLRHDFPDYSNRGPIFSIRKQFMTRPVTPTITRAIAACFAMVNTRAPVLRDASNISGPDMLRLFMKLFVLSFASSSEVSYPIHRFLAHEDINLGRDLPPHVLNFLERVLEQKEPMDCVTQPMPFEKSTKNSLGWKDRQWLELFHVKFRWNDGEDKQAHEKEGIRFHDGLEFMARIPLTRKTTNVFFTKKVESADSSLPLLVVFFQKRQSDLDPLENPIDGKVFTLEPDGRSLHTYYDVKPEYEECFLYFVPNNASNTVTVKIKAELHLPDDNDHWGFRVCLEHLLDPLHNSNASVHKQQLPLILFRACALALLGPNAQRYTAWKEAFDMEKLDSTPHGLQCIVDSANELLNRRWWL